MIETGRQAIKFGNIDSYAKYLYHKSGDSKLNTAHTLNKLKLALTYYFVRQQVCVGYRLKREEKRHLNFITSLVNEAL